MQIKISIDSVGTKINDYIEKKFSDSGYPPCLGSMVPPVISKQVFFEELSVLTEREAVNEKEVVHTDLSKIVDVDSTYSQNKIMTKNNIKNIETYKENRAEQYAEQVIRCCQCTFTGICNKLTNNYLKVLSIQESIKLQEILKTKVKL